MVWVFPGFILCRDAKKKEMSKNTTSNNRNITVPIRAVEKIIESMNNFSRRDSIWINLLNKLLPWDICQLGEYKL